jgi:hypothetical protein
VAGDAIGRQQLKSDRETDVVLGVGSRGVGAGAFTWIDYENVIPTDKYPTLDIVYPPKQPGDLPLREHYELNIAAEGAICTARFGSRRRSALRARTRKRRSAMIWTRAMCHSRASI